jgi:hypothetical protein
MDRVIQHRLLSVGTQCSVRDALPLTVAVNFRRLAAWWRSAPRRGEDSSSAVLDGPAHASVGFSTL